VPGKPKDAAQVTSVVGRVRSAFTRSSSAGRSGSSGRATFMPTVPDYVAPNHAQGRRAKMRHYPLDSFATQAGAVARDRNFR